MKVAGVVSTSSMPRLHDCKMYLYVCTLQQRACYIPCLNTNLLDRAAVVSWIFTVHLDQAVGWCAGKADKGGVQAGEAGLQQRCSQLETALLQGLQQVCRLRNSVLAPGCRLRRLPL